ncbi:MAG: trypsin-like peptidase domain-containing protein [Treponema sp.]|nr:trypsin-like peptidase domain-containing protein [Treponema sp.]
MRKINLIAACAALFILAGCTSIDQPSDVYVQPDYTLEDVRNAEIKRILPMLETNNVQAMFRACLLGDEDTKNRCFESVTSEYNKKLEEKDYFNARRLYKSLHACSYPALSSLKLSLPELDALCNSKVPEISKGETKKSVKVSSLINGTVTVWVDKGIKVENGYGFADRVIGSGFFITKDGYIITNNHVIADVVDSKNKNYSKVYVKLAEDSDTKIPARVVGWDPLLDLALLKTEADAPYCFSLGSSEDLDVGDKIYCIGSPVGLERTLTSGIVSARDRKLFTTGSVLQIDAAVNSGNSGGPCVDVYGNVQAIVFAGMLQYEGLNFAIPVEYLKALLPALFNGEKLVHPWLGTYGHTKKDLGKETGLEVQYVLPGSGSSRAGLKAGDVIVSADGKKVSNLEDMQNILLSLAPKTVITIEYINSAEEKKSAFVYLSSRPENPGYTIYTNDIISGSFIPIFGLNLASVSERSKMKYTIKSVIKGSVADESGFSENEPLDIIDIDFDKDKKYISAHVYSKNRKKGYIDVSVVIAAPLDSPYYF